MLKRMTVGFVFMVLVVAAVGLGLVTASRMRAPSEEQAAALALLAAPVPPQGSNAYPALLLMEYDVPEAEVEALARAEAERFNRTTIGSPGFELKVPWKRTDTVRGEPANCSWSEPGCLEKVRSNRDAFAERLESQQALLQRIANLSRHGHYRSLMDPRMDVPFPAFQMLNASTTQHALWYVDGNVEEGLAGVCGDVLTWRTLAPNADSLIASMIGVAIIEGSTSLFADMLAPLPADHPLPSVCAAAFAAPVKGELSLCQAMRGEAMFSRSAVNFMDVEATKNSPLQRAWQRVVYDQEKTDAMMAPNFAWACTGEVQEQIDLDVPAVHPGRSHQPPAWRFECAGNAAGCMLADIAAPAYSDYTLRMQDAGMALRTMGTVLWIRERRAAGDTRTVAELVASQPAALASASRPVEVVDGGTALQVPRFDDRRGKFLKLPLP